MPCRQNFAAAFTERSLFAWERRSGTLCSALSLFKLAVRLFYLSFIQRTVQYSTHTFRRAHHDASSRSSQFLLLCLLDQLSGHFKRAPGLCWEMRPFSVLDESARVLGSARPHVCACLRAMVYACACISRAAVQRAEAGRASLSPPAATIPNAPQSPSLPRPCAGLCLPGAGRSLPCSSWPRARPPAHRVPTRFARRTGEPWRLRSSV